jgi:anti-sigma B factor antagonist
MLKIDDRTRPEGTVLSLDGTVDMYASPDLKGRLDQLTEGRTSRIVIDLSGVDFIDSSGLAALVGTQRRMKRYEGRLQLTGLSERVTDVFALMQLTDLFEIHETVDEALGA